MIAKIWSWIAMSTEEPVRVKAIITEEIYILKTENYFNIRPLDYFKVRTCMCHSVGRYEDTSIASIFIMGSR